MKRFEVQTNTICDGWVNTWMIDDEPQTFATIELAQAEIDETIEDMDEAVADGYMDEPSFTRNDLRIV